MSQQFKELSDLPKIHHSQIRLKNIKNFVFGLQGSGKTYFAKQIIKSQNLKVLVYSPHLHDFDKEPDTFIYYKYVNFYEDFETFLKLAIELGKKKEIDLVLIDEADMLAKSGRFRTNGAIDFIANHRHYNLGGLFLARRPQDIDALIVESCEFLIAFSIFGDNVKQKLNRIYNGYGDLVQKVQKGTYNSIVLEIGQGLKLMEPIERW